MCCYNCKATGVELRIDMHDTAFGPAHDVICKDCYDLDCQDRRDDGRRHGYRPKIVRWEKLELTQ